MGEVSRRARGAKGARSGRRGPRRRGGAVAAGAERGFHSCGAEGSRTAEPARGSLSTPRVVARSIGRLRSSYSAALPLRRSSARRRRHELAARRETSSSRARRRDPCASAEPSRARRRARRAGRRAGRSTRRRRRRRPRAGGERAAMGRQVRLEVEDAAARRRADAAHAARAGTRGVMGSPRSRRGRGCAADKERARRRRARSLPPAPSDAEEARGP